MSTSEQPSPTPPFLTMPTHSPRRSVCLSCWDKSKRDGHGCIGSVYYCRCFGVPRFTMQDAETLARLWPFEARRELSGTDARAFEKVLQKMEAGMKAWGTPNDQTRIRETIRKLRQQVMTPPASIDTRPSLSEAPLLARPSRLNPLAREFLPSSSRLEPSIHFSNAAAERQQGIEMRRYSRL